MFKKRLNFLISIVVVLSGCASSMQMSRMDREATGSIKISEEVTAPATMYYYGPGQQALMLLGPIGGAIAGKTAMKPAELIAQFARENNIFIEQIVKDEFDTQLVNSGKFQIINNNIADAKLEIRIFMYGLTIPHGFSSKLVPILKISANLINNSGKTIWSNSDYVFGADHPSHSLEEIKNNPELLKEAWTAAAKKSVSSVIRTL